MGILDNLIHKAKIGRRDDVDYIIYHLTKGSTLAITRFVDYALSLVENPEGISRIEYYLFNGTQIQRNYSCLYFNRKNEWEIVKEAFKRGFIDEIQAYSM